MHDYIDEFAPGDTPAPLLRVGLADLAQQSKVGPMDEDVALADRQIPAQGQE